MTFYTEYRADVREEGYHEMFVDLAVWPVLEALKQSRGGLLPARLF